LAIESNPGSGTTMRIYLPRHDAVAPSAGDGTGADAGARAESKNELPLAGGGELILLVEDEERVRRTAASTLRELGYRVVEAGTAATALEALYQVDGLRLLFTDIVMPGFANGYALAREAVRRRPGLRVLYTSAY